MGGGGGGREGGGGGGRTGPWWDAGRTGSEGAVREVGVSRAGGGWSRTGGRRDGEERGSGSGLMRPLSARTVLR